MSDTTTVAPATGPGALSTSHSDHPFLLSATEWASIQRYVADAQMLPITDATFKTSLGIGAPDDLSDFRELITTYININTHCNNWKSNIFPKAVDLASDMFDYGSTKAPVYYPPIGLLADQIEENPDDDHLKAKLSAILHALAVDATNYQNQAAEVKKMIAGFNDVTFQDKLALKNAKAGLEVKFGNLSAEVQKITNEIQDFTADLKAANDEYDHDVIVATTTLSYGWIPFYGWIAGGVTAGLYGKWATEAKDRARAKQAEINSLSADLARDANLNIIIHRAESGMEKINDDITSAIAIIEKIQGVWSAISTDLSNLSDLIQNDIVQAIPALQSFGADAAVRAWKIVADESNDFRVNAFVEFTPV